MFHKIYERLHLVQNVNVSEEEKQEFKRRCYEMAAFGYGIQEIIDCIYDLINGDFMLQDALSMEETAVKFLYAKEGETVNLKTNVIKQKFYFKVLQHRDGAICWPFIEAESAEAAKISGLFEYYYPDGYTILAEYTEEKWRNNRPWESEDDGRR